MTEFNKNITKIVDTIVRRERECNLDVSNSCKDEILENIYISVRKNRAKSLKRRLYIAASSIAAVIAIGVIMVTNMNLGETPLSYESIVASTDISQMDKITIFNEDFNMELPSNATIENTISGDLIVNGLTINIKSKSRYRQITVPKGEIAKVTLSDGSRVTVNSNSRLVYKTGIDDLKRDAYIIGEAFFDIAKDDSRPFAVGTKHFSVNVTGTKFIVKANNSQVGSVALISGSVNISLDGGKNVYMSPNDIFELDGDNVNLGVIDNMSYHTSWVDRLIEFDRDSLSYVAEYISNFYGVEIIVADKYKNIQITGKLDLKEDINKVLNVVSILAGLEIQQTNDNIYTLK